MGTLTAGEIVNHFCQWQDGYLLGDWQNCWFVFAAFALVIGVAFALMFNPNNGVKGK